MPHTWLQWGATWGVFTLASVLLLRGLGLARLGHALDDHWQYLDRPELLAHPWASLLDLHAQPPLLNAVVWLLAQFPGDLYANFVVLNAGAAAFTACLLMRIVGMVGLSGVLAWAAGLMLMVSPVVLLNVAYPFYPCLTAAGYAALMYALMLSWRGQARCLWWFGLSVVYLSWLRSSFSAAHLLVCFGMLWWLAGRRLPMRALGITLVLSLGMLLLVPAKNFWRHGVFQASSWAPLNLANGTGAPTPLGAFPTPATIRARMPDLRCERSHGFQDQADVKHNGEPNYNSCLMIAYGKVVQPTLSKGYVLRRHVFRAATSVLMYASLPDHYTFLAPRADIATYADAFDRLWWPIDWTWGLKVPDVRWQLVLACAVCLGWFLKHRQPWLGAALLLLAMHAVTHTAIDGEEAQRFAYDMEFMAYFLVVVAWRAIWCVVRQTPWPEARDD